MTWYEFLLFMHIAAAMIWLGGAFTFQMYGAVVRRGGDPEEMARFGGAPGCSASGCSSRPRSWSSSRASG